MRVAAGGRAWRLAIGVGLAVLLVSAALLVRAGASGAPALGKAAGEVLQARLGDEPSCAAYGGLPAGWGSDAHAGMVHVEGGSFVFGSERGYPDERPAQPGLTRVKGFWIDRTEVTRAQFAAFVAATGYVTEAERQGAAAVFHVPTAEELGSRPYAWWTLQEGAQWRGKQAADGTAAGNGNLPVTLVTQADALAYARWLGRDLPTEAEWEYAGKAGRSDGQLDTAPADAQGKPGANYWQGPFPQMDAAADGHAGLAPVGCYAANGFGLHDMIGNVWEWTSDPYTGPRQPHANGDTAVAAGAARAAAPAMVIKGGSFLCSPDYCVRYRASARESQERDLATAHIGFRTVRRD
ncbi:MAG TPA: formylglycine-generating enzyme family protein [Pseudoduganella sp.]|jgi:formylglycine-generating enzyme required for sulfatase activity